jgi:hypothetical protein
MLVDRTFIKVVRNNPRIGLIDQRHFSRQEFWKLVAFACASSDIFYWWLFRNVRAAWNFNEILSIRSLCMFYNCLLLNKSKWRDICLLASSRLRTWPLESRQLSRVWDLINVARFLSSFITCFIENNIGCFWIFDYFLALLNRFAALFHQPADDYVLTRWQNVTGLKDSTWFLLDF